MKPLVWTKLRSKFVVYKKHILSVIKLRSGATNASTSSASVSRLSAFPEPVEGFQALNLIQSTPPHFYMIDEHHVKVGGCTC